MPQQLTRRTEKTFAIVPIEWLALPAALDGSAEHDLRVARGCNIAADNDLEAIDAWLAAVATNEHTYRLYRHHVERGLLWAVTIRGKALSLLSEEDTHTFERFLADPQPRPRWISAMAPGRDYLDWRPFRTVPSVARARQIIQILSLFFKWLTAYQYIRTNPWYGAARWTCTIRRWDLAPMAAGQFQECVLSMPEWIYVMRALDDIDEDEKGLREKLVIYLAYYAGLKPGEILGLQHDSFSMDSPDQGAAPIWKARIPSREPIRTPVILLPPVVEVLDRYLAISSNSKESARDGVGRALIRATCRRNQHGAGAISQTLLHRISIAPLRRAAEIAKREINAGSGFRLSQATLGWLTHSFELHSKNHEIGGDNPWYLLSARETIPRTILGYYPDRRLMSAEEINQRIAELAPMWAQQDRPLSKRP